MGMHWEQLVDRRFVIQKISEHGTSNPIVARLTIQTFNLLEWLDCDAQRKEDLIGAYLELNRRLLQCFDHQQRLVVARAKTVEATQGVLEKGNYSVPFVIGLQEEAEGFLLAAKNYLRELACTLNLLFDAGLETEAAIFWDKKGGRSAVAKWAVERFGEEHPFATMIISESEWVSELVKKRNAVEHPGGHSGSLDIQNIKDTGKGLMPPVWHRVGEGISNPVSDVFRDIEVAMHNLLTLAEDLLVDAIRAKPVFPRIDFAEIPEGDRKPEAPVRIKPTIVGLPL